MTLADEDAYSKVFGIAADEKDLNLRSVVPLAMLDTHFNISTKGINDDVRRARFSRTSSLGGGGKMAAGIFITLTQSRKEHFWQKWEKTICQSSPECRLERR